MSDGMNRRTFLGKAAGAAAAGASLGGLQLFGAEPATQPACHQGGADAAKLEWRNKQPTMAYAKLGRTNFMVSRAVFGGGVVKGKDDLKLVEIALERGVNYIDTGRAYKQSESAISEVLQRSRDKVWIVSKAGPVGEQDMAVKQGEDAKAGEMLLDQIDKSLKTLKIETIDCYMLQGVKDEWVLNMDGLYDAFNKAKKAGKVRYFGLAVHASVPEMCSAAAKSKRYDVALIAVNPNSAKTMALQLKAMREAGIGVVGMKTSGPIAKDPKVYDGNYEQMFAGQTLSPYQRAYAYMLARGGIDTFMSNMPNVKILEENLAVPTLKLPQASLDAIERKAILEARGSCRHCGACSRSCPNAVGPADLLRCHSYLYHYGDAALARETYESIGAGRVGRCATCGTCRAACPEHIDLPAVIAGLRDALA